MSRFVAAILLVATASPALADCPAAERAALETFDRNWAEVTRRGDRSGLEAIYADDYLGIGLTGTTTNKAAAIDAAVRNVPAADAPRPIEDNYVIVCTPASATITHRNIVPSRDGSVTYSRSVHVLEKRGGRWQVVTSAGHALTDAAVLTYIEQDWNNASRARDTTWYQRNLAENFTGVRALTGEVISKADAIRGLREDRSDLTRELSDISVRMLGDAAVVTGVNRVRGRDAQGQAVDRRVRFTDTFVRRDGRWIAVASQSTVMP